MAKTVNLTWWQGQTYRWSFVWASPGATDADPAIPRDVTGCTGRMQLRAKYGAPVLLELSSEDGGIVVGPGVGQVQIVATAAQTDALGATEDPLKPRTVAKYDLELTYPSGDVQRIIEGIVTIRPNITRDVP